MLKFLKIKRFEAGKVYVSSGKDGFFEYKLTIVQRGRHGVIQYGTPAENGILFVATAKVDILNLCEYVTIPYSRLHNGRITFYADRVHEEEQP